MSRFLDSPARFRWYGRMEGTMATYPGQYDGAYPIDITTDVGNLRTMLGDTAGEEYDPPVPLIYGLWCSCHPERGIRYVGQTRQSLHKRLIVHKSLARTGKGVHAVSHWIRKHDPENLMVTVLQETNGDRLNDAERNWIWTLRSDGQADLNLTDGGFGAPGVKHTEETKRLISEKLTGKKRTLEMRQRQSQNHRKLGVSRGSNNGRAQIDEDTAVRVYLDCWSVPKSGTMDQIARKYGITNASVQNIKYGRAWTHVTKELAINA